MAAGSAQVQGSVGLKAAAISGGRVVRLTDSTLALPVGSGYRVTVTLNALDMYDVRREFVRGGTVFSHGCETVFCDDLGETAYRASCYVNVEFGEGAS